MERLTRLQYFLIFANILPVIENNEEFIEGLLSEKELVKIAETSQEIKKYTTEYMMQNAMKEALEVFVKEMLKEEGT